MADLPHLAWPFQFGNVVEQDTVEELMASAAVIACTPIGFRADDPSFGITSPMFDTRPLDSERLAKEFAQSDPRLSPDIIEVSDIVENIEAVLRVDVSHEGR